MSDTFLSRMCYASTATAKCNSLQIGSILESAFRINAELDVTGALFFGNNYFMQFLEGPRDKVNLIYHKIALDDRHTDLQILEFKEVGCRYFEEWSMKYVRFPHVIAKILRESRLKEFNPYLLDGFAVSGIAEAFRNHHDPELASMEPQPIDYRQHPNQQPLPHPQQAHHQQIYHAYHEYHPQVMQSHGEKQPHPDPAPLAGKVHAAPTLLAGKVHKSRSSGLLHLLGLRR